MEARCGMYATVSVCDWGLYCIETPAWICCCWQDRALQLVWRSSPSYWGMCCSHVVEFWFCHGLRCLDLFNLTRTQMVCHQFKSGKINSCRLTRALSVVSQLVQDELLHLFKMKHALHFAVIFGEIRSEMEHWMVRGHMKMSSLDYGSKSTLIICTPTVRQFWSLWDPQPIQGHAHVEPCSLGRF